MKVRVATYNLHKCKGMDGRVDVGRVRDVIDGLDADLIALQECLLPQAKEFEEALGVHELHFGTARSLRGVHYGNATLSRLPIRHRAAYDVTHLRREPRGVLRTDVAVGARVVRFFNVHLGTSYLERKAQAGKLLSRELLGDAEAGKPRIIAGDFNEWTDGSCSRRMKVHFRSVNSHGPKRRRTYPGMLPVLNLDEIYFDAFLKLDQLRIVRTKQSLLASDHLPMVADFSFEGEN